MLQFDLTNDMVFSGITDGADPLVFIPDVDWDNFEEPNIIDAF